MKDLIIVRGGGDLATGTIHRLWRAGFRILVLETATPAAIRRQVSLCEAVYEGSTTVEGLTAQRVNHLQELDAVWAAGNVPILVDPDCQCLKQLKPQVLVDAILAKKNLGVDRAMAPMTIALGPGFTAGEDVDVVIETCRGHQLGRVITSGRAKENTGVPGMIGCYGKERVIYAPEEGTFRTVHKIGDIIKEGETLAYVENVQGSTAVPAAISGIIRGLLRDGFHVTKGFKIADIDPRMEELENCWQISDKSRCIAGSVLEQVCIGIQKRGKRN